MTLSFRGFYSFALGLLMLTLCQPLLAYGADAKLMQLLRESSCHATKTEKVWEKNKGTIYETHCTSGEVIFVFCKDDACDLLSSFSPEDERP